MKKLRAYISAVLMALALGIIVSACGAEDKGEKTPLEESEETEVSEVRQIEKEVLAIHDEVMPKMAELNNTRKKLIGTLASSDTIGYSVVMRDVVDRLGEADSLMWDWMHNYSRPDYDTNLDSARLYLTTELEKVRVMRDKFNRSLDDGTKLLEKLNSTDE